MFHYPFGWNTITLLVFKVSKFILYVHSVSCRFTIAYNGLALGAVADFGAQNCQYTTNVDARYNVQLTTSPAIEPSTYVKAVN
jgi:hypothetical protein